MKKKSPFISTSPKWLPFSICYPPVRTTFSYFFHHIVIESQMCAPNSIPLFRGKGRRQLGMHQEATENFGRSKLSINLIRITFLEQEDRRNPHEKKERGMKLYYIIKHVKSCYYGWPAPPLFVAQVGIHLGSLGENRTDFLGQYQQAMERKKKLIKDEWIIPLGD